ncbi:MAG: D-serine ammonia-lyase, partial [Sporolactobacillus laevolacticus]|nr:D-serine ammonia-lyase [Sporolactobacillus laevolacticus]
MELIGLSEFIGMRSLDEWRRSGFPILNKIIAGQEVTWLNPNYGQERSVSVVTSADVADAEERLHRFAPYFEAAFPETRNFHGFIESPLYEVPKMMEALNQHGMHVPGHLIMKADSELPISGSIKARGGIYEVLKTAEQLAIAEGMLKVTDNYAKLADTSFKKFFSQYSIAVGSTGNLGLSIGIVGAKFGFHTTVHMS